MAQACTRVQPSLRGEGGEDGGTRHRSIGARRRSRRADSRSARACGYHVEPTTKLHSSCLPGACVPARRSLRRPLSRLPYTSPISCATPPCRSRSCWPRPLPALPPGRPRNRPARPAPSPPWHAGPVSAAYWCRGRRPAACKPLPDAPETTIAAIAFDTLQEGPTQGYGSKLQVVALVEHGAVAAAHRAQIEVDATTSTRRATGSAPACAPSARCSTATPWARATATRMPAPS
jgi:hypothetical protein